MSFLNEVPIKSTVRVKWAEMALPRGELWIWVLQKILKSILEK